MLLESARYYIWYAAWTSTQGNTDARAASLCKVCASESALTVVQEAFELWAATGYMKKNPIENHPQLPHSIVFPFLRNFPL